jgi:hypothetical protein
MLVEDGAGCIISYKQQLQMDGNIALCSLLKANWRFGGTCNFNLQGRKINQAMHQRETDSRKTDCQRIIRRCIAEYKTLRNDLCQNLSS